MRFHFSWTSRRIVRITSFPCQTYYSESSESLIHEERNLIEMAKFRLPSIFQESMRPLERLALLQHYGVPTRLLDIT
ncbi:MAG: FRG domain-containing protein [Subdoligranulum sp.]